MPARNRTTRIACIGLSSGGLDAQILRGFNIFRHAGSPWVLDDLGHARQELKQLLDEPELFDGVLANVTDPAFAKQLANTGLPVVDLAGFLDDSPFPSVGSDPWQIGAYGADYFLERHFTQFLFVSNSRSRFESGRWAGFRDRLLEAGRQPLWSIFEKRTVLDSHGQDTGIHPVGLEFLRDVKGPIAVMAASDRAGAKVCDLARSADLSVPEQVAVLGVDNVEFICDSSLPPLSSIALAGEKIGFEAGRLLQNLIQGEHPGQMRRTFPPLQVVTRKSTDVTAIQDARIAKALAMMREQSDERLSIGNVAKAVGMGRRTFYRRFEKAVGRTPLEELYRLRVERAKYMLSATALSVYDVAIDCGFGNTDTLNRRFKELTGSTPTAYRSQYSLH